jgi:hypothetical protein
MPVQIDETRQHGRPWQGEPAPGRHRLDRADGDDPVRADGDRMAFAHREAVEDSVGHEDVSPRGRILRGGRPVTLFHRATRSGASGQGKRSDQDCKRPEVRSTHGCNSDV